MSWGLLALFLLAPTVRAQEDGSGAAPALIPAGGIVLFYNSEAPLSFVAMTPGDLPSSAVPVGAVRGHTCQYSLSVPLSASLRATSISAAAGNGGYKKTVEAMRKERPELAGIYDVKVDLHTTIILGIFRKTCTEILARGFRERS